ncbi:MAG: hypothetical protein LBJ90_00930 [Treponema sp.]|nr:hypothetical protein [Treponema sp.]
MRGGDFLIIKKTYKVIDFALGAMNEKNIFHSGSAKTAVSDSGIPRWNSLRTFGSTAVEADSTGK